ncbi:MAG: hypothetical protein HY864_12020 [Chloroflexi bacterium]|nr:hypothetical protein [Chloroflexota bacterium]
MNDFHPDSLLELAKQKTQQDVANCLAWKRSQGFSTRRLLFALGAWMVANGEKLQARSSLPLQKSQLGFSQDKAR